MFAQAQTFFASQWDDEMQDTVTIRRTTDTTRGALNTTTLEYDADSPTVVYTGAAQVHRGRGQAGDEQFGEERVDTQTILVRIPVAETGPDSGDQVTVDASTGDSALIGLVLNVEAVRVGTHATRRELVCTLEQGVSR